MKLIRCSRRKLNALAKSKNLIIWGLNDKLLEYCRFNNIAESIEYVIDNNPHIWNTKGMVATRSVDIVEPKNIAVNNADGQVIVIFDQYYNLVFRQILGLVEQAERVAVYYYQDVEDRRLCSFRGLFSKLALKEIIVFRSGPDRFTPLWDYSDNARALFEHMIEERYDKKYKLVWIVQNRGDYKWLEALGNVKVLSGAWANTRNIINAFIYQYYIYMAKYIFFTDGCRWMRFFCDGQLLINLWHGCGFKTRKSKAEPTGTHYHYMLVTSTRYAQIHADIYGCDISQMLCTGLPKQDTLFKNVPEDLGPFSQIAKYKKCIFWLPTLREAVAENGHLSANTIHSQTGLPLANTLDLIKVLDAKLRELDCFMLIKLHPLQDPSKISIGNCKNILLADTYMLAKAGLQINSLMPMADALISDYSSAAVDYMLLDRPIAFALEDIDEYAESRGFVFDPIKDYLPGKELYTFDDLLAFIEEVTTGIDISKDKRRGLMDVMHDNRDGNSCARLLEFLGIDN